MTQIFTYQSFLKSGIGLVLIALSLTYVVNPLVGILEHDMEILELGELEDTDSEEKEQEKEKEKEWREQDYLKARNDMLNKRKGKLGSFLDNSLHLFHYMELSTPPPERHFIA